MRVSLERQKGPRDIKMTKEDVLMQRLTPGRLLEAEEKPGHVKTENEVCCHWRGSTRGRWDAERGKDGHVAYGEHMALLTRRFQTLASRNVCGPLSQHP